jgi:hypothetical protein
MIHNQNVFIVSKDKQLFPIKSFEERRNERRGISDNKNYITRSRGIASQPGKNINEKKGREEKGARTGRVIEKKSYFFPLQPKNINNANIDKQKNQSAKGTNKEFFLYKRE